MRSGDLTKIIDEYLLTVDDELRNYIGASVIGSSCLRKIWYQWNGFKGSNIEPKFRRTFMMGKAIEIILLGLIDETDVVIECPREDNNFLSFADKDLPYFQGNLDSLIVTTDEKIILEIKSAKQSSYAKLLKHGVYHWDKGYYSQIQAYMGMSGIGKTIVLAWNKDNSELYDEFINYDQDFYDKLKSKAKLVYQAKDPLPRVSSDPCWFECKMCKFNEECHK